MQNGLVSFENKDKKWAEILQSSLFIGMISAFLGYVFSDVSRLWLSRDGIFTVVKEVDGKEVVTDFTSTSGLVPVFVMLVSALAMCVCGLFVNKPRFKWVNDYALPICMLIGMAAAIPLTMLFGGAL
jgi:ABC-type Mn2+/Zn2+ transport system permease subunit